MQPVDVSTEIIIAAPRERVAAYAADPDNAPAWYVNIDSAEWRTPRTLRVGAQIAFRAQFLGRQLDYVYEIVSFEPGRQLVMRTADGPFPMQTTYTWESTPEGHTRMTLNNSGRPAGFAKIFAPIMAAAMRRANTKDLQRLKQLVEQQTP